MRRWLVPLSAIVLPLALLPDTAVAVEARDRAVIEDRGAFGPELQRDSFAPTPGASLECEPDSRGFVVRLIEQLDESSEDSEYPYRQLIERRGADRELLEEPYAFAPDPFLSFPAGIACSPSGSFVVSWAVKNEPCLRVRAFGPSGAPTTEEEFLTPDCASSEERILQLDHDPESDRFHALWIRQTGEAPIRKDIVVRTLVEDTLGSEPPVVLKRFRSLGDATWQNRTARMIHDSALVVWLRKRVVRGKVVRLDGSAESPVFRISLSPDSPTTLEGFEDLETGRMIPRWNSYWQTWPIGRVVAVSTPTPSNPTTTTTTLPDHPDIPWFDPAQHLQRLRDRDGPQGTYPPSIAADSHGNAVVVWSHINGNAEYAPSYSRWKPAVSRWSRRRELEPLLDPHGPWNSYRPRIVTDDQGRWLAMWVQSNEGACAFMTRTSEDGGRTWADRKIAIANPFPETFGPVCRFYDFQLAVDPDGAWIAAWVSNSESGDPVIDVSRSLDRGETWSLPVTAVVPDVEPWGWSGISLAAGENGSWGMVWSTHHFTSYSDREETGGQVLLARSFDGGVNWSGPRSIAGPPGQSAGQPFYFGPRIASDRKGAWIAAWASTEAAFGPAEDWDIFVRRSTDDGQSWSDAIRVADYADEELQEDTWPSLATDGEGRWLLAWQSAYTVPGAAGLDFDVVVASSDDAGKNWTTPVAIDRGADFDKRIDREVEVAGGGGRWFAAWTSRSEIPETFGTALLGASMQEP